jgi:DNA-binding transcriptional regulator YiaG
MTFDLRKKRKEMGLSVVELSRIMGVHIATMYLWETGKKKPSPAEEHLLNDIFSGRVSIKKQEEISFF